MQNTMPTQISTAGSNLKQFASTNKSVLRMVAIGIVVVLAGVVTGGLLSGKLFKNSSVAPGVKSSANEVGSTDQKAFKDTASGILRVGGIQGEGMYHLERPGGDNQNVYLTSTVIDLSSFVGKQVQIWGETVAAKHAGWLMDVGKVKITQ